MTDTLSIKQEASSDMTRDVSSIEKNFGMRIKLSADTRNASRLSEQYEIFGRACYVFIKTNESISIRLDSGARMSELPNTGSVFVDKEGAIKNGR